jgi:hypothetical protein
MPRYRKTAGIVGQLTLKKTAGVGPGHDKTRESLKAGGARTRMRESRAIMLERSSAVGSERERFFNIPGCLLHLDMPPRHRLPLAVA